MQRTSLGDSLCDSFAEAAKSLPWYEKSLQWEMLELTFINAVFASLTGDFDFFGSRKVIVARQDSQSEKPK